MGGDIRNIDLGDVAVDFVIVVREVRPVGLLAVLVPFGREDAAPADGLEPPAQPADPGEQIDEGELGLSLALFRANQLKLRRRLRVALDEAQLHRLVRDRLASLLHHEGILRHGKLRALSACQTARIPPGEQDENLGGKASPVDIRRQFALPSPLALFRPAC